MKKNIRMRPRAESEKTPTQLSFCWSEENRENSDLSGPGQSQERPQHNVVYVGVRKMKKIHAMRPQGDVRNDPNTTELMLECRK